MRVKHPTIPDIYATIPDADADAWATQGWEPAPETDPAPTAADNPPPATPTYEEEDK